MPASPTPPNPSRVPLLPQLTREFLLHHAVCPLELSESGELTVAVAPNAIAAGIEDLAILYRAVVRQLPVSDSELAAHIERAVASADRGVELERDPLADADDLEADVRDLANQPPVVRYVNLLVRDAYEAGASDIHLEATRTGLVARYRLDGVLTPAAEPPAQLHHAVVSRIKLLADLDIAERRRPQDGRIRVPLESRELDLRVSTVPTMHGESVVLRLLVARF